MPRPRVDPYPETWTTASPEGSGCSSGLLLPPLATLLVSGLLALFAYSPFVTVRASPLPPSAISSSSQPVFNPGAPDDSINPANPAGLSNPGDPASIANPGNPANPAGIVNPSDPVNPASLYPGYTQVLSPIFTPEVQYWGTRLLAWSAEFGLDPNLAATVMQIESCGYARALSRSGAIGLFQVMPFHFAVTDSPFDPDTNARRGLAYLARSLERAGGDPRLALAGYNGGVGVIGRGEGTWSAQTQRYVYYGAPVYTDASAGLASSEMLNEWYLKYGVSLCQKAHESLGLP